MTIFSWSCGNEHQQREIHPSPSFPHILVTQWTKWHACRQPNWLQHFLPKCASISTSQHYAHKSCQFEHVLKTPIQVLLKFVCTCVVKHLLLMEAEPEGGQLWILSLLSPDGHQGNFSFSLFSLSCFCLCPKTTLTAHVHHQL